MKKSNYLLVESLISTISVYMILKKLMSPWEDWDEYKLGIIDKEGNKKKHPITSKERESWDMLTRLCWNLKKITSKFIGKSKFAQYFSAAYLLKDSITPYILIHQEKLHESLLHDMNYSKQFLIYRILKDLPEHNNLAGTTHNNLVEIEIFKCVQKVASVLESYPELEKMFEDESGATVQADIAQFTGYLGATKKTDPMKLARPGLKKLKKRKSKNEDNG
jgi:hypothetical protein